MKNQHSTHIKKKNIIVLSLLGFASGLPLPLTTGTLQAWITDCGFDIKTIGFMTLVGQAYVFKFLWSPLMDRYQFPFLGQRRGWMFITQLLLAIALFILSFLEPKEHLYLIALLATCIAFFSASQDIAFDAYKTDIIPDKQRGLGVAISVFGYRVAMLLASGGALFLAGIYHNWQFIYQLMAFLMLLSTLVTYYANEPIHNLNRPKTLEEAIIIPFKDFFSRRNAWILLLLIIFYKMGDALAASLSTTFLMTEPKFSLQTIGIINKSFGLVATIIGAIIGGILMLRLSLFKALFYFGLLQAFSNIGYWFLAITPITIINTPAPEWLISIALSINANFTLTLGHLLLSVVIFIENSCGGMATSAFVALIMSLCNKALAASQFAFLSSLAAIGRIYVGPLAASLVEYYGWSHFYLLTILISLPSLFLLWICRHDLTVQSANN